MSPVPDRSGCRGTRLVSIRASASAGWSEPLRRHGRSAIGARSSEGDALGDLANAYADIGETRRAIQYLGEALVNLEEIERPHRGGACDDCETEQ
jgi:hypothetical protein